MAAESNKSSPRGRIGARKLTQRPVVEEQIECVERHRDESDEQIGERQAQQEVIRDRLQADLGEF